MAMNLAGHELLDAIKMLLVALIRDNTPNPSDLAPHLMSWAQTYVGHPVHPAI